MMWKNETAEALRLLRERLEFDPDAGIFRWNVTRGEAKVGKIAGHIRKDGYRQIRIGSSAHLAHRIVWAFHYGNWPKVSIDHINGNPSDNWVTNLRLATVTQNQWNSKLPTNNTSGIKNVTFRRGRYLVHFRVCGRPKQIGSFATLEEASRAATKYAEINHGQYARRA